MNFNCPHEFLMIRKFSWNQPIFSSPPYFRPVKYHGSACIQSITSSNSSRVTRAA